MSIQHVGAVLHSMPELRDQTAAFTLAVIAESADRRTGWTFDFVLSDVASYSRVSFRYARKRLRYLEEQGYIKTRLRGRKGRQRMQFRVLFDFAGARKTEAELYPQAAARKPPPTPVPRTSPPVPRTSPPVRHDTVPSSGTALANKDRARARAHAPSLSVSIRKEGQNGRRLKKMPEKSPPPDINAERQRQLAALREKGATT